MTVDAPLPRQPVDLRQLARYQVGVTTHAVSSLESRGSGTADVRAAGYFRGQRLGLAHATTVVMSGQPDLVVTDVQPEPRASIAVRADFDPGAVAILLDYSGSMSFGWGGSAKEKAKKEVVIDLLRNLLPKLPPSTRLTVRLMHKNTDLTTANSEKLYPVDADGRAVGLAELFDKLEKIKPDGATPLLPSMRSAIGDMPADYEGVKTLIVLTDGADTTKQLQVFGPKLERVREPRDMTPEQKQQIGDLVRKDVETFANKEVSKGASVHMVIFGSDQAEEELAVKMFQPVEEFEPRIRGRVYRAKDEGDLQRELLAALRPKVQLLKNETPVSRTQKVNIPPNGMPTNRTGDFQADGTLWWRGPVAADQYDLAYHTTRQGISLDAGDAMCVEMNRRPDGGVDFRRELYFKSVDRGRAAGRMTESDDWLLTAPEYGFRQQGDFYLVATAALEGKNVLSPGVNGLLRQEKPRFLWWELLRPNGQTDERLPRTVYVRNAPGLPAPSWRVVADHGRLKAGLTDREFKLRAWPMTKDPLPLGGKEKLSRGDMEKGGVRSVSGATLRVKLEDVAFVPDTPVDPDRLPPGLAGKPLRCLVVRVDDPTGRLLRARVSWQADVKVAEHQYFYEKADLARLRPKVIRYTAVFGPVTDDFVASRGETEIELLSVADALADDRNKPLVVDLRRPAEAPAPLDVLPPFRERD